MEIPKISTKISVIIPLFNAEKYIGECLDSILAQTFQDFEVIVVDDCSTDKSVAIVQSYEKNFGGRLKILHTKKNSGGGAIPRNEGFKFSQGEYIFFVDSDDMITPTALEELHTVAKNFDADLVYTSARYLYTSEGGAELKLDRFQKKVGGEAEPRLLINEPHKFLNSLLIKGGLFLAPWTKFIKREFLLEEDIKFYNMPVASDSVWTIELFSCVKRFLRYFKPVYLWRVDSETSVTYRDKSPDEQVIKWSKAFLHVAHVLADVSAKRKILRENPVYYYHALKRLYNLFFRRNLEKQVQFEPEEFYELLCREFKSELGIDMTTIFFLSFMYSLKREVKELSDKKVMQWEFLQSP